MKLGQLSAADLGRRLRSGDFVLRLPPFVVRIHCDVASAVRDIGTMYGHFEIAACDAFADFHIQVKREPGLRRWYRPQARFFFDGQPAFAPLPADQRLSPLIKSGLNWCVAAHSHQYLVIHAAVVERGGCAVLLPAPPGSGKSTLCAAPRAAWLAAAVRRTGAVRCGDAVWCVAWRGPST